MFEAVKDSGGFPLSAVDTVASIPFHDWQTVNQPGALAAELKIPDAHAVKLPHGGESGVMGMNWLAQRIVDGKSSVAILTGANLKRSIELAARRGETLSWADESEGTPESLGSLPKGTSDLEDAAGMNWPPFIYPIFENALRHHYGRSLDEHMQVIGRMFSRFTEVAAANPHAWFPTVRSADELITVTPQNRMVGYPYPKYLNAILNTNQTATLVLMSAEQAQSFGIPEERWVHWWGGNRSQEKAWFPSTRDDFATTPSMLDSHLGALANAGIGIDDVGLIDFYSCFPAAVEMAVKMLGMDVDDPRNFTVTGGLPYAGGPGSSYTLHAMATMVSRLREQPDAVGLVTGNGYYFTKAAANVWSARPFAGEQLASERSGPKPSDGMAVDPVEPVLRSGRGTIEAYTVIHGRSGDPECGIVLGRLEDGARFLANTPTEVDLMNDFTSREQIGASGSVVAGDGVPVYHPE